MSSIFVTESNNSNSSGGRANNKSNEPIRPKRPRSSLACIRCRKKKVKCDFIQPTCGRCVTSGLPCSYATPPRRVDGQAFDQLGNHVEELKERMQRMHDELQRLRDNGNPFTENPSTVAAAAISASTNNYAEYNNDSSATAMTTTAAVTNETQQPVSWKLSLSPSGLRIDTNIASVADLYKILLNGISQLNINQDSTLPSLFSADSVRSTGTSKTNNNNSARLYGNSNESNWEGENSNGDTTTDGHKLWEVNDYEVQKIVSQQRTVPSHSQQNNDSTRLPLEQINHLMATCYHSCFLAYQNVNINEFVYTYHDADPLLTNSINAWISKHGYIYHSATGQTNTSSRNSDNMGETYFKEARTLLKKCFDVSSPTTIQALLNLYMYQLASEKPNLAYLYIGLAIRMAQDLKLHKKEYMPTDLKQREINKRLWWSAYWLDLCAALESNRPTMVDDKDCDLEYPVKLDCEDEETGYRVQFSVHSIKLMKIRKDITKHLPSGQSGQYLLSTISRLESVLASWLSELPSYFRYYDDEGSTINPPFKKTGSFKDEACLILNIQHQTTWIMLHKFFLPKKDQPSTPVALLSLNICSKSANSITKMLEAYCSNQLHWCHFNYALDGVVASVTIHQVNSQEGGKDELSSPSAAYLAQRNLVITAHILRNSPLTYMQKVNEITNSIREFLKSHRFSTDIASYPLASLNANSSSQSLSSVFHPNMFESAPALLVNNANMVQSHCHQEQKDIFNDDFNSSVKLETNTVDIDHNLMFSPIPHTDLPFHQQQAEFDTGNSNSKSNSSPISTDSTSNITLSEAMLKQNQQQQQQYNNNESQHLLFDGNNLFQDMNFGHIQPSNSTATTIFSTGGGMNSPLQQFQHRQQQYNQLNNNSSVYSTTVSTPNEMYHTTNSHLGSHHHHRHHQQPQQYQTDELAGFFQQMIPVDPSSNTFQQNNIFLYDNNNDSIQHLHQSQQTQFYSNSQLPSQNQTTDMYNNNRSNQQNISIIGRPSNGTGSSLSNNSTSDSTSKKRNWEGDNK